MASVVFSTSERGATHALYNGFRHGRDKSVNKDGSTYWRCLERHRYKCPGSLKLLGDMPTKIIDHNHVAPNNESDKENYNNGVLTENNVVEEEIISNKPSMHQNDMNKKEHIMTSSPSIRRFSPWSEKELLDAVMAIEMGTLDTQAAAQTYRIPISTIRKEIRRISASISPIKKNPDKSSLKKVETSPVSEKNNISTVYPLECYFCDQNEDDKEKFGDIIKHKSGLTLHVHCTLFSSGLAQNGDPKNGLMGFTVEDIESEGKRGKRLKCVYCGLPGATIGCVLKRCKRVFHFHCGAAHDALNQFFGNFSSFCSEHRPVQKLPDVENISCDFICVICMNAVNDPFNSIHSLFTPCCGSNFYHRQCIQRMALNAGVHFLKCPLCNNKDNFQLEMLRHGINIPDRDATWESEPNAFRELNERHSNCDVPKCFSRKGRNYNLLDSPLWEIVLCDICGSKGCHLKCGALKNPSDSWECKDCKESLNSYSGRAGVKKKKSVKKNSEPIAQKALTSVKPKLEALYKKRKRGPSLSEDEEYNESFYTSVKKRKYPTSVKCDKEMQKTIENKFCKVNIVPLEKVKDHYISRLYTSTLCRMELSKRRLKTSSVSDSKTSEVELVSIIDSSPKKDYVSYEVLSLSQHDDITTTVKSEDNSCDDSLIMKSIESIETEPEIKKENFDLDESNQTVLNKKDNSTFDMSLNESDSYHYSPKEESIIKSEIIQKIDKENRVPHPFMSYFSNYKPSSKTNLVFGLDSTINKCTKESIPKKYDRYSKLRLKKESSISSKCSLTNKVVKNRRSNETNKNSKSPTFLPEGQKLISQFFKSPPPYPVFDVDEVLSDISICDSSSQSSFDTENVTSENSCLKDISSEMNKIDSEFQPNFKCLIPQYPSCNHNSVLMGGKNNNVSLICLCSSTQWHEIGDV